MCIEDTRESFTFFCTCVSGQTVRPRHDLSHPARTKKQIDASSRYISPPPLPSVDMPISAGHRTTDKTSFIIRARRPRPLDALLEEERRQPRQKVFGRRVHRACTIFSFVSPLRRRRSTRAIPPGEGGGEKGRNLPRKGGFRPQNIYASARDSVCASNITHNREDRFSDGFTHSGFANFNDFLFR